MRIIAGQWRSRRISAPPTRHTRPMPHRIREAIFDMLGVKLHMPGHVPETTVADMFAGSGCMGLEAISRGATSCDFIERGGRALATLRENIRVLDADAMSKVQRADSWTIPLSMPRPKQPYGLIFVDPPYAEFRDASPAGRVYRLLNDLFRASWANANTIITLHHEKNVLLHAEDSCVWKIEDHRVYGSAAVTFVTGAKPQVSDEPARDETQESAEESSH